MSLTDDRREAERWLSTAEADLRAARALEREGMYAHACFLAQQCAEKSLKAMWHVLGQEPWGHSIQKLIREYPEPDRLPGVDDCIQRAARLDKFYIPTRYPNGLPDLTPHESYFPGDAQQAIEEASFFLDLARRAVSPDAPDST